MMIPMPKSKPRIVSMKVVAILHDSSCTNATTLIPFKSYQIPSNVLKNIATTITKLSHSLQYCGKHEVPFNH